MLNIQKFNFNNIKNTPDDLQFTLVCEEMTSYTIAIERTELLMRRVFASMTHITALLALHSLFYGVNP